MQVAFLENPIYLSLRLPLDLRLGRSSWLLRAAVAVMATFSFLFPSLLRALLIRLLLTTLDGRAVKNDVRMPAARHFMVL